MFIFILISLFYQIVFWLYIMFVYAILFVVFELSSFQYVNSRDSKDCTNGNKYETYKSNLFPCQG